MFCSNCGSLIPEGGAFCSACGSSVVPAAQSQNVINTQMQQYQAQKNAVRQSEINALDDVINHFSQKSSQFEEYDLVCGLVNDYARGAKSSLLVWGCIITTFGLLGLLSVLAEGSMSEILGMVAVTLLPGILMIFGGIRMKVNNRKQYAYFQGEYARLSQELYEHYACYPNCPIGPEYANPEILYMIMDVLQSGRADTIKESINLLVAEADQAEFNEYLAMIEQNTADINAQTRVAAFFAAASFFK